MRPRRLVLAGSALVLSALAARRAHALRDPSELSVGGATGEHDAHLACGPDVRVRHANGGIHYERVFESAPGDPREEGKGLSISARAGVGTTTVLGVSDTDTNAQARALEANEKNRTHVLGSAQLTAGYDFRTFALRGGLGYFSFADLEDQRFVARRYPLPVIEMRIGKRRGFRGDLGVGAPPIPGLARWYALYAILSYRFAEGGDVGVGNLTTFGGVLDRRSGILAKGSFPITDWLHVGGFGTVEIDETSKLRGLNWNAGAGVTVLWDE